LGEAGTFGETPEPDLNRTLSQVVEDKKETKFSPVCSAKVQLPLFNRCEAAEFAGKIQSASGVSTTNAV
jgi:hypothetical protein